MQQEMQKDLADSRELTAESWVYAGNHHVTVRGLQRAQLFDDQEQEDDYRPPGIQQVLPALPQTYFA